MESAKSILLDRVAHKQAHDAQQEDRNLAFYMKMNDTCLVKLNNIKSFFNLQTQACPINGDSTTISSDPDAEL